jgi:hypothetical protein
MLSPGSGPRSRVISIALALALLCPGVAAATSTTLVPQTVSGGAFRTDGTFTLTAAGFTPASLAVVPGTTVIWTGPFATQPLLFDDGIEGAASGTSFSASLGTPGRFRFHTADTGSGELSGSVYVAGPVPALRATQISPPDPRVRLDASATDFIAFATSAGAQYEFDGDGDGTFDSASANPILSYRYPGNGTYKPIVRVTDENGFSASATTTVIVSANGLPPLVDKTAPKLTSATFVRVGRLALRKGTTLVLGTPSERVTATVTLLRGTSVIARATSTGTAGRPLTVRLHASKAGARILTRRRPQTLTVRVVLKDTAGNTTTKRRTLPLKSP